MAELEGHSQVYLFDDDDDVPVVVVVVHLNLMVMINQMVNLLDFNNFHNKL